jgi:hypothetical protein
MLTPGQKIRRMAVPDEAPPTRPSAPAPAPTAAAEPRPGDAARALLAQMAYGGDNALKAIDDAALLTAVNRGLMQETDERGVARPVPGVMAYVPNDTNKKHYLQIRNGQSMEEAIAEMASSPDLSKSNPGQVEASLLAAVGNDPAALERVGRGQSRITSSHQMGVQHAMERGAGVLGDSLFSGDAAQVSASLELMGRKMDDLEKLAGPGSTDGLKTQLIEAIDAGDAKGVEAVLSAVDINTSQLLTSLGASRGNSGDVWSTVPFAESGIPVVDAIPNWGWATTGAIGAGAMGAGIANYLSAGGAQQVDPIAYSQAMQARTAYP